MNLTAVRTTAAAVITALAALETFYPGWQWITVVIAVGGVVGIHVIPSVGQPVRLVSSDPSTGENMSIEPGSGPVTTPVASSQVEGGPSTAADTAPAETVAPELADPLGNRGSSLMGIAPPVTADVQAAAEQIVAAVQDKTADLPQRTEGLVQRLEDAVTALENKVLGKL